MTIAFCKMAKKQRHESLSTESSVPVTSVYCAAAAAPAAATGNIHPHLPKAPQGHDPIDSTYILSPQFTFVDAGFRASGFMHKQKTTEPEKDNTAGQQPEATALDKLMVAPPTSFPDSWFEKQFFANTASLNPSNIASTSWSSSLATGSGVFDVHPTALVAGTEDRRTGSQFTAGPQPPAVTDSCSQVNEDHGLMHWRPRPTTQDHASTSSTDQPLEPTNKRRKKRPSGATTSFFSDSDGSDDDDDDYDDDGSVSDVEEDEGATRTNSQQFAEKFLKLRSHGKPCNFWQYNSQARGPKGRRICGEITLKDCHVLDEFSDPVAPSGSGKGHANKLRHGEGNDPRPDAQKLMEIGSRISRLEDEFRGLTDSKTGNKDEVGRQKNKLASRICRLKKKAQHEANKVKLEGLREEHEQLVSVAAQLVTIMETHFRTTETTGATSSAVSQPSLCSQLETLIQSRLKFMIAGHASEYVNMQLQKAAERLGSTGRAPV